MDGRPSVPAARATTCSTSSRVYPHTDSFAHAGMHSAGAHRSYGYSQFDESACALVERAVFTGLGDVVPGFAQFGVSGDELPVGLRWFGYLCHFCVCSI